MSWLSTHAISRKSGLDFVDCNVDNAEAAEVAADPAVKMGPNEAIHCKVCDERFCGTLKNPH